MPSVPRYSQPTVEVNRAPQVRSNISAPAEAFGGGSGTALAQAGQAVGDVGNVVTEQIVLANQARNREYEQKVMAFEAAQYQDGGAFLSKGGEIFKAREDLENNLKKLKNEMIENAPSEFQKQYIEKMTQERFASLQKSFNNHFAGESTKYFKGQNDAGIELAKHNAEMAFFDPKKREQAWRDIEQRAIDNGRLLGLSGDEIAKNIAEHEAEMNYRIVGRFVEAKNVAGGRAFFEANKEKFGGKHYDTDKLLRTSEEEGKMATAVYGLVEKYNDYGAAFKAARELYTPEEVAKMDPLLKTKMKDKNDQAAQVYSGRLTEAIDYVTRNNGDLNAIPDSLKDGMNPEDYRAVQQLAMNMKGIETANEKNNTYPYYSDLPMAQFGRMSSAEFALIRPKVTAEQWEVLSNKYQLARKGLNGDKQAQYEYNAANEDSRYLFEQMQLLGFVDKKAQSAGKLKPEDSKTYYLAEKEAMKQIQAEMYTNGGKISDVRRREIINGVMNKKISKDVGWISTKYEDVPVYQLKNSKAIQLTDTDTAKMIRWLKQYKIVSPNMSDAAIKRQYESRMKEVVFRQARGEFDSGKEMQQTIDILRGVQ